MEEKDLIRLLDMLYNMVDEAKSVAFSSEKCAINRDEALDLIEEIREKLPVEIKNARKLIDARNEYIDKAKQEGESIIKQAEVAAKEKISESEILAGARQKSSEILHRAEERSKELYRVTNTYTEDALRRVEEAVETALKEIQQSRTSFKAASQEKMQQQQDDFAKGNEEDL